MGNTKQSKLYTVRAYCSKCGKLLQESIPLSKKELINSWDKGVLDAAGMSCKDCNTTIPNFYINLRVYHAKQKKEYDPKDIIPAPKNPFSFE